MFDTQAASGMMSVGTEESTTESVARVPDRLWNRVGSGTSATFNRQQAGFAVARMV
jgi:hypothetical protein